MKKYLIFFAAIISFVSCQLQASMENAPCSRWYMGGVIGVNHINSDYDEGPQLGFSLGYRLSPSIRLEGELTASVNRFKEAGWDLNTGLLMANILYDINLRMPVRPYVGFGAGSLHQTVLVNYEDCLLRFENDAFAYQGIFGLMVPVSSRAFACLEYRYVENSDDSNINQSAGLTLKRYF